MEQGLSKFGRATEMAFSSSLWKTKATRSRDTSSSACFNRSSASRANLAMRASASTSHRKSPVRMAALSRSNPRRLRRASPFGCRFARPRQPCCRRGRDRVGSTWSRGSENEALYDGRAQRARLQRPPSPDLHFDAVFRVERDRFADGKPGVGQNGFRRHSWLARGENRPPAREHDAMRAGHVKRVVADGQEEVERALAAAYRDFAAGRKHLRDDVPAGLRRIPPPGVGSLLESCRPLRNDEAVLASDVGLEFMAVTAEYDQGRARLRALVIFPILPIAQRDGCEAVGGGDHVVVRNDGVAVNFDRVDAVGGHVLHPKPGIEAGRSGHCSADRPKRLAAAEGEFIGVRAFCVEKRYIEFLEIICPERPASPTPKSPKFVAVVPGCAPRSLVRASICPTKSRPCSISWKPNGCPRTNGPRGSSNSIAPSASRRRSPPCEAAPLLLLRHERLPEQVRYPRREGVGRDRARSVRRSVVDASPRCADHARRLPRHSPIPLSRPL